MGGRSGGPAQELSPIGLDRAFAPPRSPGKPLPLNPSLMPLCLVASMARMTDATLSVTGPASALERLRRAAAGDLGEVEAKALAVELDTLAGLLAARR